MQHVYEVFHEMLLKVGWVLSVCVTAALIGEENLANLTEIVHLLQEGEENLTEGFTVTYQDQEYNFVPQFIDRC